MTPDEKLQAGEQLADAGRDLLALKKNGLSIDERVHRSYLMRKIADDLLRQAMDMGYTKQYDCSPKLGEYELLAYEIAFECFDKKPDRRLIPFLVRIRKRGEYDDLLKECLEHEKVYLNTHLKKLY